MEEKPRRKRKLRIPLRTLLRWGGAVLLLVAIAWLALWLTQRSFMSQNKKRAMQTWLDEKLNADVSLLSNIAVRVNLVRRSRLTIPDIEIEHPNPLFSTKFAQIGNLTGYAQPLSVLHLWPGTLEVDIDRMRLVFEQNESGDWSSEGLMNPLSVGEALFPFPAPSIANWVADITNSSVMIRRIQHEVRAALEGQVSGRVNARRVTLRVDRLPFSYGVVGDNTRPEGILGPATVVAQLGEELGDKPRFLPGYCHGRLENAPARMLPFLFPGIPLENVEGVFNGLVQLNENPQASGTLSLEGELRDVPLAVFGLPRQAPVRVDWPIKPSRDGQAATIRMGPSGFGAFTITMPLDTGGMPTAMIMRGDVASLDDMPGLFTRHSRWPDWLSRMFPTLEWRAGRWLGFGWSGSDMLLQLTRSTTGLNLTGEAEMMGGRVRIAMTPGQPDAPVTVAAEHLDAQALALKLSQWLPEPFRLSMSGAPANLSWRGMHDGQQSVGEWNAGLVFARPVIDLAASGEWWKHISTIGDAVIEALPEWGGGDPAPVRAVANTMRIPLEQLSIVAEKDPDGRLMIEFRAYGDTTGQATGMIEQYADGVIEGEFFLAGESEFLEAVIQANPDLGLALELIAMESVGLRVLFIATDNGIVFSFPFLQDARTVHQAITRLNNAADALNQAETLSEPLPEEAAEEDE